MSKVATAAARAFLARKDFHAATRVIGLEGYCLHNSLIAWHSPKGIAFNLCGYVTRTTIDSLNHILAELRYPSRLTVRAGMAYLGADEVPSTGKFYIPGQE